MEPLLPNCKVSLELWYRHGLFHLLVVVWNCSNKLFRTQYCIFSQSWSRILSYESANSLILKIWGWCQHVKNGCEQRTDGVKDQECHAECAMPTMLCWERSKLVKFPFKVFHFDCNRGDTMHYWTQMNCGALLHSSMSTMDNTSQYHGRHPIKAM